MDPYGNYRMGPGIVAVFAICKLLKVNNIRMDIHGPWFCPSKM